MPLVFYGKVGAVLGQTFRPCRSVCFPHFPGEERRTIFFGKFIPLGSKAGVGHKVFRGNLDSVFAENKTLDLWRAQCPEMKFGDHLKSDFFWVSQQK